MYHGSIPEEDLARDAEYMKLTKEQFMEKYLMEGDSEDGYQTKNVPCDFLEENGNCRLGDYRPESCKNIRIRISRTGGRVFTACWM